MKISGVLTLGKAALACFAAATLAVSCAFFGAEAVEKFMAHPAISVLLGVFALTMLYLAAREFRRNIPAALLHAGLAIVCVGWIATSRFSFQGSMALVDGDSSDVLMTGDYLDKEVGRLPFTLTLEKFFVKRYAGEDSPVKEYRSHVLVDAPQETSQWFDIRVNHPARVKGYWIYQMSWGETENMRGELIRYTVLQFRHDPGWAFALASFVMFAFGAVMFVFQRSSSAQVPSKSASSR